MLCSQCKKNQATKTYERLKKGKKEIEYYCLNCYHNAFLSETQASVAPVSACPYCNTTVAELKKRNLVGCAYCYTTLGAALQPTIKKMQGDYAHIGKKAYETTVEKTQKRRQELEVLAEKCYSANDDIAGAKYDEQISRLLEGYEEEFVWDHRLLSKQS